MSSGRLPIIDPLLPNAVGSFDEFMAPTLPMLDYDDDPSAEFSLGAINIG